MRETGLLEKHVLRDASQTTARVVPESNSTLLNTGQLLRPDTVRVELLQSG